MTLHAREIMLKCTQISCDYMRLPAGMVEGYSKVAALYQRLAEQSRKCAQAWVKDKACPSHEPAVDAFWWGVVAWADAFGTSVGVDKIEWERVFIRPHRGFAEFLCPGPHPEPLPFVGGPPADIILRLDALWMERVIKLTAKWGLMTHLKDKGALIEAQRLGDELRNPHRPAYKAYLESDIRFFRELFRPFPFSIETHRQIDSFLHQAEEVLYK